MFVYAQRPVRANDWGVILRDVSANARRVSSTRRRERSSGSLRRHYECSVMTKHRFVRCSPSALLVTADFGHDPVAERGIDTLQHWRRRAESERGNAVHWYDHIPVIGDVGCCLSVDQAVNGAVAHLTATASLRRGVLPKPLVSLALSSWSHHKLLGLARVAESEATEHRL
jgi:hypothetical protein